MSRADGPSRNNALAHRRVRECHSNDFLASYGVKRLLPADCVAAGGRIASPGWWVDGWCGGCARLQSGSGGALLRPRPLGTGRAASTATGSGKLVRLGRSGCHPSLRTSLGPFTAGAASNLSAGSGPAGLVRLGSPDPVGTLSGSGMLPVSGQLCGTAGGGPAVVSRVPAAFRRAGIGFGVILCPLGDGPSLRSADQAQLGLDPNGIATFNTDQMRPGRVLPLPRGGGVLPTDTGAARSVIGHQVDQHAQPEPVRLGDERVEDFEAAEPRVDLAVV